jgi:hypothetical protein
VLPSFHRLPASAQAEPAHKIAAIKAEFADEHSADEGPRDEHDASELER